MSFYDVIDGVCDAVVDGHGDEDKPGRVPIFEIKAHIQVEKCCQNRPGKVGEFSVIYSFYQ